MSKGPKLGLSVSLPKRVLIELTALLREWPARMAKFQEQVVYDIASHALLEIQDRIPNNEDTALYRDSLRLARIQGDRKTPGFAVFSSPRARRVKKLDGPKTLLYVRAKGGLKRALPVVKILEKYSPWTLDTLPFTPRTNQASIVSVKVSEKEVAKVAKDRKRDRPKWRLELDREGIREVKKPRDKGVSRKVKAIPSTALTGFRMEFGTGGAKAQPHWRPAIRSVLVKRLNSIKRNRAMANALIKLGYQGWKRWPPRVKTSLSRRDLKKFVAFQKRLGIRG